jgi:hypothetical protein
VSAEKRAALADLSSRPDLDDTQPLPALVYDDGAARWCATCPETGARAYGGTAEAACAELREASRGRHAEALRRGKP